MTESNPRLSICLPAFNEAENIGAVVRVLRREFPDAELLVVNDCSRDDTARIAEAEGARVVSHPYNMGNGAAVKTGARHARGEVLAFMDADGQHAPEDLRRLLEGIDQGHALVVGARSRASQASPGRLLGNSLLNRFASLMTGREIPDLTSGFRAVRAEAFREFLYLLPNGFSYPTTSTMAFLRSGYPVAFVPIHARARQGKSKISFVRDGIRFLVIVMKITTLFSPMRLFLPLSLGFFIAGLGRYLQFFFETGAASKMSGVLLLISGLVFLIGLVSEQITALHYGVSSHLARHR